MPQQWKAWPTLAPPWSCLGTAQVEWSFLLASSGGGLQTVAFKQVKGTVKEHRRGQSVVFTLVLVCRWSLLRVHCSDGHGDLHANTTTRCEFKLPGMAMMAKRTLHVFKQSRATLLPCEPWRTTITVPKIECDLGLWKGHLSTRFQVQTEHGKWAASVLVIWVDRIQVGTTVSELVPS